MEICLYDPVAGYYSRNAEQFGKAGDFYTSSDIHAVFGRLLARQFEEMWQALDRPAQLEILELGPGRGLLARDLLDWSRKKFPDFFAALKYTLQESSPALQVKLHETLGEYIESGRATIRVARTLLSATLSSAPDRSMPNRFAQDRSAQVPEERPKIAQRFSAGSAAFNDQVPEGRLNAAPIHDACEIHRVCAPETPLILFANEFFDALPVEILSPQGKLHIAFENGHLTEIWLPPANDELEFLDRHSVHPEPNERLEVPLAAQRWLKQAANAILCGFLLVIDYGYTRSEQLAGRHRGTLMAYRQHSASPNAYQAPGEQDLTAHVNFTALSAGAEHAGMRAERLITQSQFLMGIGEKTQFADAFEDCSLPQERAKVALQLKHLATPAGMGETFHVLVASREVDPTRVAALSGLSFGVQGL